MYEFWSPDKMLLMIGLLQFGLILIMFMIFNVSNRKVNNENPHTSDAVKDVANNADNSNSEQTLPISSEVIADTQPCQTDLPEVDLTYKVDISPELMTELLEISNNPTASVDEAIRWWLRRRNIDALNSVTRDRRYPVGLRSHDSRRSSQDLWND